MPGSTIRLYSHLEKSHDKSAFFIPSSEHESLPTKQMIRKARMTEGIKRMPLIYMSFSRKIKKSTEYVSCSTQRSDFKCLVDRLPCVYFNDVYATQLSPTCATSRTPSQDLLKYLLVRLERRG